MLILFVPAITSAQETKHVVEEHQNPFYTEDYNVLISNPKVKYGPYLKRTTIYLNETGFYKNGAKDSMWTYYDNEGTHPISRGKFSGDKKVGEWEYFSSRDFQLDHRYNHTTNELVFLRPSRIDSFAFHTIIHGRDTTNTTLTQPLYYIGGLQEAYQAAISNIMALGWMDKVSISNPENGTVRIAFWVDTSGKAGEPYVVTALNKKLDKLVLKAVREVPDYWIPAMKNGEKVNTMFLMSFRIINNRVNVLFED
jgi:protein TonB